MVTDLAYKIYKPTKKCIGTIVVVHGMMEHQKRYEYFANEMKNEGYAVLTYDQRGHGESAKTEKALGFFAKTRGWKLLIQDCFDMVSLIKSEYPGVPCILFGHSMGSIVVRSFIKRYDTEVQSVILCGAPTFSNLVPLGHKLSQVIGLVKGKRHRSELLKEIVLGSFNKSILDPKTPCDWISKNDENVLNYINDPLCQFNFTTVAYEDLLFGMMDMNETMRWNFRNKNLNILFISGSEDPCTGKEKGLDKSVKSLKEAGYTRIERRTYVPLRHEILNEIEKDKVIQDCIEWLKLINVKS